MFAVQCPFNMVGGVTYLNVIFKTMSFRSYNKIPAYKPQFLFIQVASITLSYTEVEKGRDEVVRRATVQYQNSNEEEPRYTDRAARSLIKLFNIDDGSWQEDMDIVEKLIEDTKVEKKDSKKVDTRYRLKATDGEETVQRKVGVQHLPSARLAKTKFTRPCISCCCLSHCEKNPHNDDNDKQLVLADLDIPRSVDVEVKDMLDRSWMEETEYEAELLESVPQVRNKFMSVLCATNMDLREVLLEDQDQTASADIFMVVLPCFSQAGAYFQVSVF